MHLLLSAHRIRPADGLFGNLRRAHSLPPACCCMTPTGLRKRPAPEHMKLTSMNASARVFPRPYDPAVIEEALKQGIPHNVIDAAQIAGA